MSNAIQSLTVLLFLHPSGLKKQQILKYLHLSPEQLVRLTAKTVKQSELLGLVVVESSDSLKLVASSEIVDTLELPVKPDELSAAALEVLTIIAYKEPITKLAIEEIRGVGSDQTIRSLVERELVSTSTSKRSGINYTYYHVTPNFLQIVGMDSLSELPKLELEEGEQ